MGVCDPGLGVWVSHARNASRKYPHTLELVEVAKGAGPPILVGVNTSNPNKIVEEALRAGKFAEVADYPIVEREVRFSHQSRVDFVVSAMNGDACYIEVKNVHLSRRPSLAEFPDCKTARGLKHLSDLTQQRAKGDRAVMIYLVQRTDCVAFTTARDIDPAYHEGLKAALAAGVEAFAYTCNIGSDQIVLGQRIPINV